MYPYLSFKDINPIMNGSQPSYRQSHQQHYSAPQPRTTQEYINAIESRIIYLGQLGSSVFVGKCYLTNEQYATNDKMIERTVVGCYNDYPYNSIQYHQDNHWLFDCFQLLYIINQNMVPHSWHNLPNIITIPRSNGEIHDAMAVNNMFGARIRTSKTRDDGNTHMILRVHWLPDHPKLNKDLVNQYAMNTLGMMFKDVYMEDILPLNNKINESPIIISLKSIKKTDDMGVVQCGVIDYCNNKLVKWCEESLVPVVQYYNDTQRGPWMTYKII